jgi:hypothetical protein
MRGSRQINSRKVGVRISVPFNQGAKFGLHSLDSKKTGKDKKSSKSRCSSVQIELRDPAKESP